MDTHYYQKKKHIGFSMIQKTTVFLMIFMSNLAVANAQTDHMIVQLQNGHEEIYPTDAVNQVTFVQDKKTAELVGQSQLIPNLIGSPHVFIPELNITGLALFPSLNDLYNAYDLLVEQHPHWFARESDIGYDQSGTYAIRHYTLRFQHPLITDDRAGTGTNMWNDDSYPQRRLIVQTGTHSNERYSILGCYMGIKAILESNDEWAMFIKQNFVIDVLPCSNPWGAENGWVSTNVNGKNLNRTYLSNIQAENQCVINLIQELKPKGLVGVIDCHNTTNGDGYLVSKPSYKHWNYYAVVTQQLQASLYDLTNEIFGTARNNHFHLWDATGNNGQLHHYADSQNLLGCTLEIKTKAGLKGSIATQAFMINLIQAFGSYVGY